MSPSQQPPPRSIPDWQLPPGVARGTWDYAHSPAIAHDYDSFHAGHPLLDLDQTIIEQHLPAPNDSSRLIDLGCGTGRNVIRLASLGWKVLAVDLSQSMLDVVADKIASLPHRERIETLHANMVQLDPVPDASADAILCMYSSFGMVRGASNRRRVLQHVHRILKPGGMFIVHVHNRGAWLRDPQGLRLTCSGWLRSWVSSWELGDRIYPYRGLPSMFLHIFSRREMVRELHAARLQVDRVHWLNRQSSGPLTHTWWMPHLRAGGFLFIARKGSREES